MRPRVISFLACALFFAGFAPAIMAQSDSLRLVYYPPWNVSKLPMYLAREMGVFERNGLKIIWTNPGSNEKLLDLMKRGEADIAVVSANHVVQSNASAGATMILVGNTGYNYSAFLADTSIKTATELKGKKIGTGEAGSTPDQLTRLALRKLGIDPEKDVTMVHLDDRRGADRVKDLLAGDIAAAMVTPEAMYDLEKTGQIKRFNRLTDHKQLRIYAGGGADYAISAALLKNRRPAAKQFMSGICEGISIARKDTYEGAGLRRQKRTEDGCRRDRISLSALHHRRHSRQTPPQDGRYRARRPDDCGVTSRQLCTQRPAAHRPQPRAGIGERRTL